MPEAIRVLIVDDNAIVRMGLRNLLEVHDGIEVVGEADDGHAGVRQNEALQPDVVLCDVRMPGLDGVGAATQMAPTTNVLMLTYSDDLDVIRGAVAAGAKGYLVHGAHQPDEIVAAVVSASRGSSVLGPAAAQALLTEVGTYDAGCRPQRLEPDGTGGRGDGARVARTQQPRDRPSLLSCREDGQEPPQQHLSQDRRDHAGRGDEPVVGRLGEPVRSRGRVPGVGGMSRANLGPTWAFGPMCHLHRAAYVRHVGNPRQRLEGDHHV